MIRPDAELATGLSKRPSPCVGRGFISPPDGGRVNARPTRFGAAAIVIAALLLLAAAQACSFAAASPAVGRGFHAAPNSVACIGDFSRGKLDGWTTDGGAWGIVERARAGIAPGYHAESSAAGEHAVGVLRSPPFIVTGNTLRFLANGWDGRGGGAGAPAAKGVNGYFLRRADDGHVLRTAAPPCSDAFTPMAWAAGDLIGQRVVFEAVDEDRGDAFAWLGLAEVCQISYPQTTLRPLRLTAASTWAILERDGGGRQAAPYLSSLGGGERGTGVIRSPQFVVQTGVIRFDLCGHDGEHGGQRANFAALRDARSGELLRQTFAPGQDAMAPCQWDTRDLIGKDVVFEVDDAISADGFAWIGVNHVDAGAALRVTFARGPLPPGWQTQHTASEYVVACGVPFLGLPLTQSVVPPGGSGEVKCGFRARRIFLLGMINTWDHGSPVWGAVSDYSDRLFIGDRIGDLRIEYADGSHDSVPLRLGHTAWWYADYIANGATEPFASDARARATLERALDIYPTGASGGHAYVCVIRPRDQSIARLSFVDNPMKLGAPAITAVTVDSDDSSDTVGPAMGAPPPSVGERRWLAQHTISAEKPETARTGRCLDALRRLLYMSPQAMPAHVPLSVPPGFRGPRLRFAGAPSAELMTNIYYHSTQDMDDKVDADGTFHTSTKAAPSWGGYQGIGTWNPRQGAYYDHAWSRDLGRVLQELTELGYESDSYVTLRRHSGVARRATAACARWCDRWLLWFPQQFPRINVKGKPVPGHWVRIINHPEWTQTPGMPAGFGNLENDGHGLIMLFHYRAWLHARRRRDHVLTNWPAIREAAEYVCWLLDNPGDAPASLRSSAARGIDVSRAHDDVLFSDSEGGNLRASIYCDMPCWLGMMAYAEMAAAAGKRDEAARWRQYADRLKRGIGRYYVTRDPAGGDIWDPDKAAVWPFGHSVLAPVLIWPDYYGVDLSGMPADWLARSRRTLREQLARCRPDHASAVAMGYGQCFITQAALLLDEMDDASRCIERLAQFTYYPRCKPYIVPEGCEVDASGKWWRRTGDLGNGVQEGEAIKCVRLVLGIDDTQPARTLFMPRLPRGWSEVRAQGYPVMTLDGARAVQRSVSFRLQREGNRDRLAISADGPLASVRVRLGPYPSGTRRVGVSVNGRRRTAPAFRSGDSAWAWVDGPPGARQLVIRAQPKPGRRGTVTYFAQRIKGGPQDPWGNR